MRVLIVDDERPAHQIRKRHFPSPSIVFVTAHVEHAVAAFEKHRVDYVLEPFSNESISEAWSGASRRAKAERAAKLIEALPQLQKLSRPQYFRIAIKAKEGFSSCFCQQLEDEKQCNEVNYELSCDSGSEGHRFRNVCTTNSPVQRRHTSRRTQSEYDCRHRNAT